MRRIVALLAALVLLASVGASSVSAGQRTPRVNHFVGNFDMTDTNGTVIGHVHADFKEPTLTRMVPGTLDIFWEPYDVANPPFPFMPLDWPPVKESHAQLLAAWFDGGDTDWAGYVVTAGTSGYLCDYTAPWNADCRPFVALFQTTTSGPAPHLVQFFPGDDGVLFPAGRGSFVLTYAGPTGG